MEQEEVLERLCGLFPYVMRLMKIMGVDENDVEDVAMEVFIDAFRGLHTLSSPEKMMPWLKTIAANRASKYFSKRAKRKEISNLVKTEAGELDISIPWWMRSRLRKYFRTLSGETWSAR